MPKNRGSKGETETMSVGMKLFLAGCVAEIYLLIVRHYVEGNGTASEMIAWYDHLPVIGWVGAVILAAGLIWLFVRRENRKERMIAIAVMGAGAFLSLSGFAGHWNLGVLTLLSALVPAAAFLSVFWEIYERECALSLLVLCLSLIVIWVYQHMAYRLTQGTLVKAAGAAYLIVLALAAYLLQSGKLKPIFPDSADPLPVYISCALAFIAMAVSMITVSATGYAMWGLALVMFGLIVYYTVRQL